MYNTSVMNLSIPEENDDFTSSLTYFQSAFSKIDWALGTEVSADRGDASIGLETFTDKPIQKFDTTLTANRTISLSAVNAYNGAKFKIVRTAGGAFDLDVGGIVTLVQDEWVEVVYNGSAWIVIAAGSLTIVQTLHDTGDLDCGSIV